MPAKIQSAAMAGNLSQNPQNPQLAIIAMYICFSTNFRELQLQNIQPIIGWAKCIVVHPAVPSWEQPTCTLKFIWPDLVRVAM